MLIDTHTHIQTEEFNEDRDSVIKQALAKSIGYIICVGYDIDTSKKAIELSSKWDEVFASVGIHPHDAKSMKDETIEILRELARNPKVVAIGETGLDFEKEYSSRIRQESAFRLQARLAIEMNLPLIIHNRRANEEVIKILEEEKIKSAIFHCFPGDVNYAREVIKRGYKISFGGPITYEKNKRLEKIVEEIPLEYFMLETDSPYLSPLPKRGKRNEPSNLKFIAYRVAEIRKLSLDDVGRVTSYTAKKFFGIGEPDSSKIVYQIRNSLYINLTNRCTSECVFCARTTRPVVMGHNLRLTREPSKEEILEAVRDISGYEEIVFCGYGEPTLRLDVIKEVAGILKKRGIKIRLDTNGHGNLIHKRNIIPEISRLFDEVSVSLNAPNGEVYQELCPSIFGQRAYGGVLDFIREAKKVIPRVNVTVVDVPGLDIDACRRVAQELGVDIRIRKYNFVG